MSFSNVETIIVASYLTSNDSIYHTINTIITDLLCCNDVSDATILLSNNLRSITKDEMQITDKSDSLVNKLLSYSFSSVKFNEIADEFIADRIAVG